MPPTLKRPPNTIHLGGSYQTINTYAAKGTILPGSQLEYVNDAGTLKLRVHTGADTAAIPLVALEKAEWNLGVDDAYADGELVNAAHPYPGSTWWMYVPSGSNIAPGAKMQSNGDGALKALDAGTALYMAEEATGAVVTRTRVRAIVFS